MAVHFIPWSICDERLSSSSFLHQHPTSRISGGDVPPKYYVADARIRTNDEVCLVGYAYIRIQTEDGSVRIFL
jgi:hypothetical protein